MDDDSSGAWAASVGDKGLCDRPLESLREWVTDGYFRMQLMTTVGGKPPTGFSGVTMMSSHGVWV